MWMPLPCYSFDAPPKLWASGQFMSELPSKTEAEKDRTQGLSCPKLRVTLTHSSTFYETPRSV